MCAAGALQSVLGYVKSTCHHLCIEALLACASATISATGFLVVLLRVISFLMADVMAVCLLFVLHGTPHAVGA